MKITVITTLKLLRIQFLTIIMHIFMQDNKVENLLKKELLNPIEKGIYIESTGFTEWTIPIPRRIDKNNVIALTNVEIAGNCEFSHIDYNLNCFRLGVKGNASDLSLNVVKLLVVYLT